MRFNCLGGCVEFFIVIFWFSWRSCDLVRLLRPYKLKMHVMFVIQKVDCVRTTSFVCVGLIFDVDAAWFTLCHGKLFCFLRFVLALRRCIVTSSTSTVVLRR